MENPFAPDGELYELVRHRINDGVKIDKKLRIDHKQLTFGTRIGGGEYSAVYEGLYKSKPVAIKIILQESSKAFNSKWKEKFEREVTLHSRARHENVVKFIGASVEPTLMIITELMRGGTLQKYLLDMRPNCPDLEVSVRFALCISRAMTYLHAKGIIHRDLKPINMLLSEDQSKVQITDFGLAREEIVGEMSTEAGTYRWMAPEMIDREGKTKKRYDHKVDVYSFSMVLWELLTNNTPFKGRCSVTAAYAASQNVRPSTEDVPKEIVPLLVSCWAENPGDRPEFVQIKHFLESFIHYLETSDTSPPRMIQIEHSSETSGIGGCQCSHLMQSPEGANSKPRSAAGRCFSCFGSCV